MYGEDQPPSFCPNKAFVYPTRVGVYTACNGIVDFSEGTFDPACKGCWYLDANLSRDLFGPEDDRKEWSASW